MTRIYEDVPVEPKNFELFCYQRGCIYHLNRDTFEYEPFDPEKKVYYRKSFLPKETHND